MFISRVYSKGKDGRQYVQLGLFDTDLHETTLGDGRRLVTRCNPVRRAEIAAARQGFETRLRAWVGKANLYLKEHPRARATQGCSRAFSKLEITSTGSVAQHGPSTE